MQCVDAGSDHVRGVTGDRSPAGPAARRPEMGQTGLCREWAGPGRADCGVEWSEWNWDVHGLWLTWGVAGL